MDSSIYLYIFVIIFIVGYTALLPLIQGVAKIKRSSPRLQNNDEVESEEALDAVSTASFSGYVPPSEKFLDSKLTKKSRGKKALEKLQHSDIPINYVPQFEKETRQLRKRVDVKSIPEMKNPDNYDYDLDELIKEENDLEQLEKLREFESQIKYENRENV